MMHRESRRSNAMLRLNNPDDHLQTILMSDGEVSAHYPQSLKSLMKLDCEQYSIPRMCIATDIMSFEAKISKALMMDYQLPDPSDSRERNLNRFMQFCGVSYQMVRK